MRWRWAAGLATLLPLSAALVGSFAQKHEWKQCSARWAWICGACHEGARTTSRQHRADLRRHAAAIARFDQAAARTSALARRQRWRCAA
jgi:hypothetical protein